MRAPLLLSLYINGVVARLREEGCGVKCGSGTIPGLLFADGTSLFASNEAGIRSSLDILVQWCKDWGVTINVYSIVWCHVYQKKSERRSETQYMVDGNEIPRMSSCKYLGCVFFG